MKKVLLIAIVSIFMLLFWQLFLRDMKLSGKAQLTWNASDQLDIKEYRIYYGTEKRTNDCPQGGYEKKVSAGKKTSYQINNLKDDATYYFSVTSVNSAGKESCFSEEMSKGINITLWDRLKSII